MEYIASCLVDNNFNVVARLIFDGQRNLMVRLVPVHDAIHYTLADNYVRGMFSYLFIIISYYLYKCGTSGNIAQRTSSGFAGPAGYASQSI